MHYLDHAATTPVPSAVAEVMVRRLTEEFGNPSAQYELGRTAKKQLDADRAVIAKALGCDAKHLHFTSCGTEGDNWAIRAALWQNRRVGKHIVTTAVEHSAILQLMKELEREGYTVTRVKPDKQGNISAEDILSAVQPDTALVSIMLVNNETGTIYPVQEIAKGLKGTSVLLHTDAVQGFLKVPFTAASLGADLITLSAHKIGGPKGIGALYIGPRIPHPQPMLFGGGQEQGIRPGTEATAQISGFAKAVELRQKTLKEGWKHMAELKAMALEQLSAIPGLVRVGKGTAPHILSVSLPGYPSQNIVNDLSAKGICISAGSACHQGKASHVLVAMGLDKKTAAGTIRISFGPESTAEDVAAVSAALAEHQRLRLPML